MESESESGSESGSGSGSEMVVEAVVGDTHCNRVVVVDMNLVAAGNCKLDTEVEMKGGTFGTVADRTTDEAHTEVLLDYLAD